MKMLLPIAWIPNGAQPAGIFGSLNGSESGLNEASKESTRALWKSAAYRRSFRAARPVYSAPRAELSTETMALVPLTVGAQPSNWPASVSNRNREGAVTLFWLTGKSVALELATVPVGPPATVTTSALFDPTPE